MYKLAAGNTAITVLLTFGCASISPAMAESANVPVPTPRPQIELPVNSSATEPAGAAPAPIQMERQDTGEDSPRDALERSECGRELQSAGIRYDWIGQQENGSCLVEHSVRLLAVHGPGGNIAFSRQPVLRCDFAELLGRWTHDIAGPVISSLTGSSLVSIDTGPGIQCRKRIGDSQTKMSEHARGNAIDISDFVLSNGQSLEVGAGNSPALGALRTAACGYFTTVLGPGANSAHQHHFHFDAAQHGNSGYYRICE